MKRFISHPLFLTLLVIGVIYVIFGHLVQPALPKSLLIQYMIISAIGVFLVASFNDTTWNRTVEPVLALMGNPKYSALRAVALVAIICGVGGLTYMMIKPSMDSPIELRTVHPAPPSNIKVYGKSFNLLKLENPLRNQADKGSDEFKEMVTEGGELYYKNCIYCHGDLLDGQGHFAKGFNPRPANFQDVGTIAQLQESYLFWRITTGGPGLPREGAPWASAMPVWHELLEEEEVWKIILFLYDYTGQVPRSWELESSDGNEGDTADAEDASAKGAALDEDAVTDLYMRRCAHCHGEEGDGEGPAAEFMYPLPRDFSLGVFKYKTTHADDEFPSDDDLRQTIMEGLPGTSMPGWKTLLSPSEVDALILKIKQFGEWEEEEIEVRPIEKGTVVASSEDSIARGEQLFIKACVQCHGDKGRGNITSGKKLKDDWENRIWPRNLTHPETWRSSKSAEDIFNRISAGIRGTPMPEHTTTMKEQDRWDIANYAMTLRNNAVALAEGETVVRGMRVEGDLPKDYKDQVWDQAPAITFPFVPNVIKDPRLYSSLNDSATVRVLFNKKTIAIRVDVDDRTMSVPGSKLEQQYRIADIDPTSDALAVQFPVTIPVTSEKPWFRHGDRKHPVNMWYWKAPGEEPASPELSAILDATGPDQPPVPRKGDGALSGAGQWHDGQWSIVLTRSLQTENEADLQFEEGRYIPVAFANWDGVNGEKGSRHSFTNWYWLLLPPDENVALLYGESGASGIFAGLLFLFAARRQRRQFEKT
jgi:DMSO reductase family type II enzyme heme b subunit